MKVSEIKILPPRRLKPFKAILSDAGSKADKYVTEAVKVHQEPLKRRKNEYLKRCHRKGRKKVHDLHLWPTDPGRDPGRTYANVDFFDGLAEHEKRSYLLELLNQVCDDNDNYSDDDIFLQMDQKRNIFIDDAVMLFYAMDDLQLITKAAPGRWYKSHSLPF